MKFLSSTEILKLFKVIKNKRDRALFLVTYRHGLRASEVGLLKVSDIDLESQRIYVTRLKGSHDSAHALEADETRILKQWIKERSTSKYALVPTLFFSNRGLPIARRTLDYLMKRYCAKAGIDASKAHFHALKHTCATHHLEAGAEIRFLQDWMGHANIQNTVIYSHIVSARRDEQARELHRKMVRL